MSGLLRQLGMQALGEPPALRPAARLRSRTVQTTTAVADSEFAVAETEIKPASAAHDPVGDQQFSATTWRVSPPASTISHHAERNVDENSRPPESPHARPELSSHTMPQPSVMPARQELTKPADATTLRPRATLPVPAPVAVSGADGEKVTAHRTPNAQPVATTSARASRVANEAANAHRKPETVTSRLPGNTRLSAPLPDVHIHIGRIELTAITPPQARREAAPVAKQQPMSLDEYLKRRNRDAT